MLSVYMYLAIQTIFCNFADKPYTNKVRIENGRDLGGGGGVESGIATVRDRCGEM